MKILVTGSTGFIGARLAEKCLNAGHEVVALGQINTPIEEYRCKKLRELGIPIMPSPLQDRRGLVEQLQGCDIVFHLAAAQHEANVPDEYFYEINVEGTRNILDASIESDVKSFVHGSTIGVFGSALDGEIDESTATRPANIYGVTKLEGENLALEYASKLPVSVIRISETYGPGDGRLLKLFKAIAKGRFFVIGNGKNIHQLIYVDDLIEAMMSASQTPGASGESIVIAGNERLSTQEMCQTIAEELGTSLPGLNAPMWPFLTAAVLMEKTLSPLNIQPPLHRRRLDFFRKSFFFSQKKANEVLSFSPQTNFRTGVQATAAWYRDNGFL